MTAERKVANYGAGKFVLSHRFERVKLQCAVKSINGKRLSNIFQYVLNILVIKMVFPWNVILASREEGVVSSFHPTRYSVCLLISSTAGIEMNLFPPLLSFYTKAKR